MHLRSSGHSAVCRGAFLLAVVFAGCYASLGAGQGPPDPERAPRLPNGVETDTRISSTVSMRIDPEQILRIADVVAGGDGREFQALSGDTVHLGLAARCLWLKLVLRNDGDEAKRVLVINNPRLARVDLYTDEGEGAYSLRSAGTEIPFYRREIQSPAPSFWVDLPQGDWNDLEHYVEARTDADFSHGLCPDCAQHLYPKYYRGEPSATPDKESA